MSILTQDVRYGLRMLRRNPGTAFAAWFSLALGIGALTTCFSVVNGLLLQPLPYAEADRLVMVWEGDVYGSEQQMGPSSVATFEDWRRETRSFEAFGALDPMSLSLTAQEPPESLFTRAVTSSYFPLYGIEPIIGRVFSEEDEKRSERVVILSRALWQQQFGSDPEIIGRKVELDFESYEVIGVMPVFHSPLEPASVQVWIPLTFDPANPERRRRQLAVWARLAQGVSLEEAREEVASLAKELERRHPEIMAGRGAQVRLAKEMLIGELRPALWMLFIAGSFLVVMVCGNVVHLLMVRTLSRSRELAMRTALGAGQSRLLRQLLTENLILSLAGGGAGLLLAQISLRWIRAWIPVSFGLPRFDGVVVGAPVLLFTLGVTLVTALVFAVMPARLVFSRPNLSGDLKAGARSTGSHPFLRHFLVVTEVALVLVLLIGTGLMVQSFLLLSRQEAGHDPAHVLTLRSSLRGPNYQQDRQRADFFQRAQEAIAGVPGVASVGATDLFILGISLSGEVRFTVEGALASAEGSEPTARRQVVTPNYFEALGVPRLQGRAFRDSDTTDTPPVALVNSLFVESYLPGLEPLGQRIVMVDAGGEMREIVGVVDNVRAFKSPPDPVATIYLPHTQRTVRSMTFVVRTRSDPLPLVRAVTGAISSIEPTIATFSIQTLEESQAKADWQSHFSMVLLGVFAALALVLAVTGVYAIMAFSVAERTREFGIRLAFGARPGNLMAIVLGNTLRLAGLGLGLGLLASLALSRLVRSQLYGVAATNPSIYVGISLLLAVIIAVASSVPARRALKVDPVTSLRQE